MINRIALRQNYVLPTRRGIRSLPYLIGALLLLALQLVSGAGPTYALLVFIFLYLSYWTVLWAGGLSSLFGLCILYLVFQHVLISQVAKVIFWEPADAGLRQPTATMGVYVAGMASLAVGVHLANRFRLRSRPLFPVETKPSRLLWLSVLCTIASTLLALATRTAGTDAQTGGAIQGGLLGPLKQIGLFGPLAVAAGTAYIINTSNGRRSFGLLNGVPMVILIVGALVGANREASVNPVIVYVLTCIAFRYRFRPKHYVMLLIGAYIANFIIFPYALIARGFVRTGVFEENVKRSASMLADIVQDPFKYRDQLAGIDARRSRNFTQFDYYSHSSPTLGRYTLIVWTDAVVDATLSWGTTGWETITPGLAASLPRFLNPDKPFVNSGNVLAHRARGLMADKHDHTTGITLGFFADAFSSFEWIGIGVFPCVIMFCLMTFYRLLINERIWGNVLALSFVAQATWGFSGGAIADMILTCLVGLSASGVGLVCLYVLAFTLDRLTNRIQHVLIANVHPRQQALQRVLANTIPSKR